MGFRARSVFRFCREHISTEAGRLEEPLISMMEELIVRQVGNYIVCDVLRTLAPG